MSKIVKFPDRPYKQQDLFFSEYVECALMQARDLVKQLEGFKDGESDEKALVRLTGFEITYLSSLHEAMDRTSK